MTTATTAAIRLNTTVEPSAKENAAPVLRSCGQVERAAEQADVLARLDRGDDHQLGDQVGDEDGGGEREQQPGPRPAGGGGGSAGSGCSVSADDDSRGRRRPPVRLGPGRRPPCASQAAVSGGRPP